MRSTIDARPADPALPRRRTSIPRPSPCPDQVVRAAQPDGSHQDNRHSAAPRAEDYPSNVPLASTRGAWQIRRNIRPICISCYAGLAMRLGDLATGGALAMAGGEVVGTAPRSRAGGGPFFGGRGGPGGPRARRGDVRAAALLLLAERPLNGYQLIGDREALRRSLEAESRVDLSRPCAVGGRGSDPRRTGRRPPHIRSERSRAGRTRRTPRRVGRALGANGRLGRRRRRALFREMRRVGMAARRSATSATQTRSPRPEAMLAEARRRSLPAAEDENDE